MVDEWVGGGCWEGGEGGSGACLWGEADGSGLLAADRLSRSPVYRSAALPQPTALAHFSHSSIPLLAPSLSLPPPPPPHLSPPLLRLPVLSASFGRAARSRRSTSRPPSDAGRRPRTRGGPRTASCASSRRVSTKALRRFIGVLEPSLLVKDRIGRASIMDAEAEGTITAGTLVLAEPASGNRGIARDFIYRCAEEHGEPVTPHRCGSRCGGGKLVSTRKQLWTWTYGLSAAPGEI